MKIAKLQTLDVANGEGICLSLWVQGCHFHCKGCHNPDTWDFKQGYEININTLMKIIKQELKHPYYSGFSVLGGEPFASENRAIVAYIIHSIHETFSNIKIWVWTGYTIEELQAMNNNYVNEILDNIDVLIDGPYIEAERDITLPLRGSRNQRIINIKELLNEQES